MVDPESEDERAHERLKRAIAMSLEDTGRGEEEPIDPNQMTEEEQIEYAMRLSLQ